MRTLSPLKAISHALKSVLTYRRMALRIGAFWVPVIVLLNLLELTVGAPDPAAEQIGLPHLVQLLSAAVGIVGISSMAVSWHRFILRDEIGSPSRLDGTVFRYAGNSILIMLLIGLPVVAVLVAAALVPNAFLALIPVILGLGVVVMRLSIKLPAVALGRRDFSFRDAWSASAGNIWQLLGLLLLNAAAVLAVLAASLLLIKGISLLSSGLALAVSLAVNAAVSLFVTLFNASIFTSLYGFFVERRDF